MRAYNGRSVPGENVMRLILILVVLAIVGWLLYRTGAKANPNA